MRVSAWDDDQDRLQRAERQRLLTEARRRHLQASIRIQELALARLSALQDADLTPSQLLRAWQLAVRTEREALELLRAPDDAHGRPSDNPDAEAALLAGPPKFIGLTQFLRENPIKITPVLAAIRELEELVGSAGTLELLIRLPQPGVEEQDEGLEP